MTSALAFSAASAAIMVTATLGFVAAGNRKDRRDRAMQQLCVAADANHTHRDQATRD
jgi:hypothetical protein